MKIIEYSRPYSESVKDLLVELQEYIVSIDKLGLNKLTKEYREKYFKKTIDETYENGGKMFLALDESGEVTGLISGHLRVYDELDKIDFSCPKMGIIEELIIKKGSRKQGTGRLLMEKIESYFKSLGCEYIKVGVFGYNYNAAAFYSNLGYENRFVDMIKKI